MKMNAHRLKLSLVAATLGAACAATAFGDPALYSNNTPNNLMAVASRPTSPGGTGIEAADDFILAAPSTLTSGTFTGLITGTGSVTSVDIEIYRVFPNDSTNPPSGNVPTRTNSPADVEFAGRDSLLGTLSFSSTTLNPTFTALNSVLNGIFPIPNQTTLGEGAVTGREVQFDFSLLGPALNLPADHYFFVPQVQVDGGSNFFWLSASRPISGAGTTSILPDLQTWVRNDALDPDWLRVGTDIVGGSPAPTFNAAFILNGTGTVSAPDSGTTLLLLGLALVPCVIFQRRLKARATGIAEARTGRPAG